MHLDAFRHNCMVTDIVPPILNKERETECNEENHASKTKSTRPMIHEYYQNILFLCTKTFTVISYVC